MINIIIHVVIVISAFWLVAVIFATWMGGIEHRRFKRWLDDPQRQRNFKAEYAASEERLKRFAEEYYKANDLGGSA